MYLSFNFSTDISLVQIMTSRQRCKLFTSYNYLQNYCQNHQFIVSAFGFFFLQFIYRQYILYLTVPHSPIYFVDVGTNITPSHLSYPCMLTSLLACANIQAKKLQYWKNVTIYIFLYFINSCLLMMIIYRLYSEKLKVSIPCTLECLYITDLLFGTLRLKTFWNFPVVSRRWFIPRSRTFKSCSSQPYFRHVERGPCEESDHTANQVGANYI